MFITLAIFNKLIAQSTIDYKNYQEIFKDDFTYTQKEELGRNWRFVSPNDPDQGWGDEYFTPEQVSLRSDGKHRGTGLLRLSAQRLPEPKPSKHGDRLFVSGKIESIIDIDGTQSCHGMYPGFTYGMFEIRCKLPKGRNGTWPTFWFLSGDTEIDVVDNLKPDPAAVIQSGVIDWHKTFPNDSLGNAEKGAVLYKRFGSLLSDDFNTYTAVWTPSRVSFFFNGRLLYNVDDTVIATHNCAGMLLATLQMKNYDQSVQRAHMDIDYIRVLKPRGNDYSLPYTSDPEAANKSIVESLPNISTAVGALIVNPLSPEEVFYRGNNDELYRALRRGKRWKVESLHETANVQQTDYLVKSELHYDIRTNTITYQGGNNQLQTFTFSTNWQHNTLPSGPL
ncbi:family 16 glycosylhydrolase [Hymenobacter sp. GOD-10R]|uniref:glycoside hydrolase family 16 protein n=1 Tax=Hymenobacter sp. GOD-10R TaxID=3093922 RepID=UPI002D79B75F|nr:family 16 glycosylhydrolase [Hymenobacter sp. GOD-10R]WRQ29385.1 family 16 glycosylhydrolase [Hymenobacter sp. GOD-10R]